MFPNRKRNTHFDQHNNNIFIWRLVVPELLLQNIYKNILRSFFVIVVYNRVPENLYSMVSHFFHNHHRCCSCCCWWCGSPIVSSLYRRRSLILGQHHLSVYFEVTTKKLFVYWRKCKFLKLFQFYYMDMTAFVVFVGLCAF